MGGENKVQCSKRLAPITSGEKTTIAKAINTHLSRKKNTELASRARDKVRMQIFNNNHVLVAIDVATATAADLKLDSGLRRVAESQTHHGTSGAQAMATTRESPREEFVLRNSMSLHPEPTICSSSPDYLPETLNHQNRY